MTKEIDAEQMVAELRLAAEQVMTHCLQNTTWAFEARQAVSGLQAALDKSAPIAGRWCLASERDEAVRERDDAQACFQKAWTVATEANTRADVSDAAARALGVDFDRVLRECSAATARAERADVICVDQYKEYSNAKERWRVEFAAMFERMSKASDRVAIWRQHCTCGTSHGQPKAYTVDQLRSAFAEACLSPETPFFKEWPAIAAAVERALASENKRKEMVAEVWGVEMRNGGWLGLGAALTGSGSSVDIVKAHRFSTKEEAEKVASEFSFAGGMAKRIDGEAVVRIDELAKERDIANANAVAWEARAEKAEAVVERWRDEAVMRERKVDELTIRAVAAERT